MTPLDVISNNLPLIIIAGSGIASFATLRNQNNNQERRLTVAEAKIESYNPIFLQIQKDLVAIQTSLRFVQQTIDRLDTHVKQSI